MGDKFYGINNDQKEPAYNVHMLKLVFLFNALDNLHSNMRSLKLFIVVEIFEFSQFLP